MIRNTCTRSGELVTISGVRLYFRNHFLKSENITNTVLDKVRLLNQIASQRGQTLAEMSLSWVLRNDSVTTVLIGASKPEQIRENVRIVDNLYFTEEELNRIENILGN